MDIQSASIYEEFFVPALFSQWAPKIVDAAEITGGHRVLDVACGTGVLTSAVAERAGTNGEVIGLDLSEGMLAVASQKSSGIEWRRGSAEKLPFADGSFDAVVSQFGLMFFENKIAALREMMRVLAPSGNLVAAVWNSLESSPGYFALTNLLHRLFGENVANSLRAPFSLGDQNVLNLLFNDAGIGSVEINTINGTARFPSIKDWIYTDVRGWSPVGEQLDDAGFQTLLKGAQQELKNFVAADGVVEFAISSHIAKVKKP